MDGAEGGSGAKRRVAVLGGGVGGITAAFELTATPELRERFDVTVYQLGWRIGGKGASGRNRAAGNRIEEHGLHLWFGFYDNAFRLMRDAYAELGRPADAPLARFEDAFKPCDRVVLYDRQDRGWHSFAFDAPRNILRPGDSGELPTFWEIASAATRWALEQWRGLGAGRRLDGAGPASTPPWFDRLAREVASDLLEWELSGADHLLELAHRLASARARGLLAPTPGSPHHPLLAQLLTGFRDWVWTHLVATRCEAEPDLRLFFTMFDVIASTVAGISEDGVLEHGFDEINKYEWSEWLLKHGAKEVTVGRTPAERSPVLRSVYDVAFGYVDGDIAKANVAAGTATNDLLRLLFSYRGALMYKMQAGMGDVVFGPLYEVLRKRGVRFEFFHAVQRLGLAADAARVDEIDVVPQVDLTDGEYEPLFDVDGLPCWPSEPLWEQLQGGEELRERGVNFELDANPLSRPAKNLRRGADFDEVVLGISVGALGPICSELAERDERFRRGLETAKTVATQAFQLWVDRPSDELGWGHGPDSVAGCYVEPLDTYCDMGHLLPRESWSEQDGVRGIAYFCGVLDERHCETQEVATTRVETAAVEFCERDLPGLWPAGGRAFDWATLADREAAEGPERFKSQYWRANIGGSERYVLTPAGAVDHRLRSDDSGFENLVLAGDWTKNGVDGGCVEAAAISGMQAARKLTGIDLPIAGESSHWLTPPSGGEPAYVEYGGRATAPGPFLSLGGKLRGFVLEGDEGKISALVHRMLDVPAAGAVHYRPLGSTVLLLVGGFDHVSSMVSPFDRWGAVREIMATFWIPVAAGREVAGTFVAERIGLTTPYILVDNPMSYLGGRETYGYAKTMGRFDPEDGLGDRTLISAFGGDFGRDEGAGWKPLLEIAGSGSDGGAGEELGEMASILTHFVGDLARDERGGTMLGGVRLAGTVVDDMLAGRYRQVFLKQFRESADGTRACYQTVVEAPIDVKRSVLRPSGRDWQVTIHHLDSHPIGDEMGVRTQRPALAFEGELDMVVEVGVDVGGYGVGPQVHVPAPNGAPAWIEAALGDAFGLIEGTARFLYRGLPRLTRLRPF